MVFRGAVREREKARVRGPTLPANIIRIMASFWVPFSWGVRFIDNPTVPKADTVSKRYSTNKWRVAEGARSPDGVSNRMEVMTAMEKAEAKMMAIVREMSSLGIVRLKMFTSSRPLIRLHMSRN